jgi:hypothetical protein
METTTPTPAVADPVSPAPDTTPTTPTTHAAPALPDAASIFSEGFNFKEGWVNHLEGTKFDASRANLAKFKSFDAFADAYVNAEKLIGQRMEGMVKVPTPDDPPEVFAAHRKAHGVPETPDGYSYKIPETLPEGLEPAPNFLNRFKEVAHAEGITPAGFEKLVNLQIQIAAEDFARDDAMRLERAQKARAELQREWGSRFDEKSMRARRVAETLRLGADSPYLEDPILMRAFAMGADLLSEDQISGHDAAAQTLSPGMQARDIQMNPSNPMYLAYHNKDKNGRSIVHPDHASAVQSYRALMARQIDSEK